MIVANEKDGTYRFAVSFLRFNAVSRKGVYTLPLIDDGLWFLRDGTKYFTTVDP